LLNNSQAIFGLVYVVIGKVIKPIVDQPCCLGLFISIKAFVFTSPISDTAIDERVQRHLVRVGLEHLLGFHEHAGVRHQLLLQSKLPQDQGAGHLATVVALQ
jgi:hypothetical protein